MYLLNFQVSVIRCWHISVLIPRIDKAFACFGGVMDVKRRNGLKIKCDCCGTETLAEIRYDKVTIMDKRHGRRHIAVLRISELIEIMQRITQMPDQAG